MGATPIRQPTSSGDDSEGYYSSLAHKVSQNPSTGKKRGPQPKTRRTLLIRQRATSLELLLAKRIHYDIYWSDGTPFGHASEMEGKTTSLARQFFGYGLLRNFDMEFFDPNLEHIFTAKFYHKSFYFLMRFRRMKVVDATGKTLGVCRQRFSWFLPVSKCDIIDRNGKTVALHDSRHTGQYLHTGHTYDWRNAMGRSIASTIKTTPRDTKIFRSNDDLFELTFRENHGLSKLHKTLLLAATFYIDIRHFEKRPLLLQKERYRSRRGLGRFSFDRR